MPTLRKWPGGEHDGRDPESGESGHDAGEVDTTRVFLPSHRRPAAGSRGSPLELVLIKRRGLSHSDPTANWVALEIVTRNTIYLVDGAMRCIGVVDRATNNREAEHSLLGATLTGGQKRAENRLDLSQPLPLPGMAAIFRRPAAARGIHPFGETSPVERVVLRIGVTTVEIDKAGESFHELTARFFLSTHE
ncbi:MAG: hypothetical protein JXB32_09230 [Deltaproteobacteria bacterium]|nr:hypothetical protein [Deltaproteobacteria bacterium]